MKEPRPYQAEAIDALWGAILTGLGFLVLATGLGKTVVASLFARRWRAEYSGRILFLAHTIDILEQARSEFTEVFGETVSTGMISGREHENIDAVVVFSTFQSMENMLDVVPSDAFDLVIVDEAHHGSAPTYLRVIEHFTPKFLIGMTATPKRTDGKDITEIFGEPVYSYELVEALADGEWLPDVDYRLMFDNIDMKELKKLVKRASDGDRSVSRGQIDSTIFLPERLEKIAEEIDRVRTQERLGQTIIFCRSLEHIAEVHKHFPTARPYHASLSEKKQKEVLKDFRAAKFSTLLVVNKLNEGVDIPAAELLVFLRSTDSSILWLQQLGRGLRGERVVILDFVANCNRVMDVYQLGIEVTHHADVEMPESLVVESTGLHISFMEELVDLVSVLKRFYASFYETWEEAAKAAQALGIQNGAEYKREYRKDPQLPSNPQTVYSDVWASKRRWVGFLNSTKTHESRLRELCYATWEEAAEAARALGFSSGPQYKEGYKQDPKLPSRPYVLYKEQWEENGGWPGFLDNGYPLTGIHYKTWEEASAAARKLGIQSSAEYKLRRNEDPRLPAHPSSKYADVWTLRDGISGFLGLRLRRGRRELYATWEEASQAAKTFGVRTGYEYRERCIEDPQLHANPNKYYPDWKEKGGWPAFLGATKYQKYATWEEASQAAKALNIKKLADYRSGAYKADPRLPSNPNHTYKQVWKERGGWANFLGIRIRPGRRKMYGTWEEASAAAKVLGVRFIREYRERCFQDPLLPVQPNIYYPDWKEKGGWPAFLGATKYQKYATWEEASQAAQALNIKTSVEYKSGAYKADPRLPSKPNHIYRKVWKKRGGWSSFLGTNDYETWKECAEAAQRLGFRTGVEYRNGYRADPRLPRIPRVNYKDVWKKNGGWKGLLGKIKKKKEDEE